MEARPFAGALGLVACQIIDADPRMGVDDTKGTVLALQIIENERERRMFDNIGKIACVVSVSVIHGAFDDRTSRKVNI